jgi:hypothetical protein
MVLQHQKHWISYGIATSKTSDILWYCNIENIGYLMILQHRKHRISYGIATPKTSDILWYCNTKNIGERSEVSFIHHSSQIRSENKINYKNRNKINSKFYRLRIFLQCRIFLENELLFISILHSSDDDLKTLSTKRNLDSGHKAGSNWSMSSVKFSCRTYEKDLVGPKNCLKTKLPSPSAKLRRQVEIIWRGNYPPCAANFLALLNLLKGKV